MIEYIIDNIGLEYEMHLVKEYFLSVTLQSPLMVGIIYGLTLGIKSSIMVFTFI